MIKVVKAVKFSNCLCCEYTENHKDYHTNLAHLDLVIKCLSERKFRRSVTKFAKPLVSNLSGNLFPVYLFKLWHLLRHLFSTRRSPALGNIAPSTWSSTFNMHLNLQAPAS